MSGWYCQKCGGKLKYANVGLLCGQCGAKYVLKLKKRENVWSWAQPYARPTEDLFEGISDDAILPDEAYITEKRNEIIAELWKKGFTSAKIHSIECGYCAFRCYIDSGNDGKPDYKCLETLLNALPNDRVYFDRDKKLFCVETTWKKAFSMQFGKMFSEAFQGDRDIACDALEMEFPIGRYETNEIVMTNFEEIRSLLIGGAPDSGKTMLLHSVLLGVASRYSPAQARFLLIDDKEGGLVCYRGLPHLLTGDVITDAGQAMRALDWAIGEIGRRDKMLQACFQPLEWYHRFPAFNERLDAESRLPRLIIVIDGYDRLFTKYGAEFIRKTQQLVGGARQAGVHLIMTTKHPENVFGQRDFYFVSTRFVFHTKREQDSVNLTRFAGGEVLYPHGEFLWRDGSNLLPTRITAAYVDAQQKFQIIEYIKTHNEASFDEKAKKYIADVVTE